MRTSALKALAATLCVAVVAASCALPETSQIPGAALEQPTMSECPTPTPQGMAMVDTAGSGGGVAVQAGASPAEAVSGEAPKLTDQQLKDRKLMLEQVNAGPGRERGSEGVAEPAPPGTESQLGGELLPESTSGDVTPTPCP